MKKILAAALVLPILGNVYGMHKVAALYTTKCTVQKRYCSFGNTQPITAFVKHFKKSLLDDLKSFNTQKKDEADFPSKVLNRLESYVDHMNVINRENSVVMPVEISQCLDMMRKSDVHIINSFSEVPHTIKHTIKIIEQLQQKK